MFYKNQVFKVTYKKYLSKMLFNIKKMSQFKVGSLNFVHAIQYVRLLVGGILLLVVQMKELLIQIILVLEPR